MPRLVALTGYKGSGKTTAAMVLEEYGYHRFSFANTLKEMCRVLGLSDEEINGSLKETPSALLGGKTPRFAMQTLGTEWGRMTIYDDLWVEVLRRKIQIHLAMSVNHRVVIDDLRFENEQRMVIGLSGLIIRVVTPDLQIGMPSSNHPSETEIDLLDFDILLNNSLSLEKFKANVRHIAETLL